jgi:hypothetical protein
LIGRLSEFDSVCFQDVVVLIKFENAINFRVMSGFNIHRQGKLIDSEQINKSDFD